MRTINATEIKEVIYTDSRDLIIKLKKDDEVITIERGELAKEMYRRLSERDNDSELG